MSKLRVQSFAISLDGDGAGPNQDLQNPLGVRAPELMEWHFHTRVWRRMHGHDDGETGVDNGMAEKSFVGIGAWILGRNMFVRSDPRSYAQDERIKGWNRKKKSVRAERIEARSRVFSSLLNRLR